MIYSKLETEGSKKLNPNAIYKYAIIACVLFLIYSTFSYRYLANYKNDLVKESKFRDSFVNTSFKSPLNCHNNLTLDELERHNVTTRMQIFFNFLNNDLNYFLCFSSLYYAIKVESYDSFRASLDSHSREDLTAKSQFYRGKNRNKCYLERTAVSGQLDRYGASFVELHLCYLNDVLTNAEKSTDLYSLVRHLNLVNDDFQVDYKYNFINGEHIVKVDEYVKLIFHEYLPSFRNGNRIAN
jgi:hypothetical protein